MGAFATGSRQQQSKFIGIFVSTAMASLILVALLATTLVTGLKNEKQMHGNSEEMANEQECTTVISDAKLAKKAPTNPFGKKTGVQFCIFCYRDSIFYIIFTLYTPGQVRPTAGRPGG